MQKHHRTVLFWQRQEWLDRIDRRFFRDRYDAQRVLQQVVLDVKEAKSLEEATGEVVKQIHAALHPEFVSLLHHQEDHGEQYEKIEGEADGVVLSLKSGKKLKTDVLLWANGRTGNTDNLGLENVGLEADSRGQLKVDDRYATKVPHIYAVGDVIGFPSLASAAYVQGRAAALHIAGDECAKLLANDIPTGIYTSPEISSIGQTEKELTTGGVPYEVGHVQFKSLARAQITGQTVGMLKILFHRETLAILGIHCFGANASGQAIMAQPAPKQYADVLHQHDVQLSDDGRSVPRRGPEWVQPAVLRTERWREPRRRRFYPLYMCRDLHGTS